MFAAKMGNVFEQGLHSLRVAARFPRERAIPYWSHERISALRDRRVRDMVRHGAATVPYYQRLFAQLKLDPREIRGADDLRLLPVLEKAEVRANPRDFVSTAPEARDAVRFTTSGTTGEPVEIWHDAASVLADVARKERERMPIRSLDGVPYFYRTCSLRSARSSVVSGRKYIQSRMFLPFFGLLLEPGVEQAAELTAQQINRFKPHVITGHGMAIDTFFKAVHAGGWDLWHPRVVIYTSEEMTPQGRDLIERRFGIPVWTLYNAIESFRIGFSCGVSAGIHLHEDLCHVRVLRRDGTEAEPGESGEVTITNLVNRATVLINYRLGDLASLSTKECSCGRTLRMMGSLDGRADDVIFLASGRTLPPRFVASTFKRFDGIRQYLFIQHGPLEFEVKLVPTEAGPPGAMAAQVVAEFRRLLGGDARVRATICDEIPHPAHGKFRYVVSHTKPSWWTDPTGMSREGATVDTRLA
jgi:phenylacetate-CoA ligase